MKKAVVLGSINFDIVAAVDWLPSKGETVNGSSVKTFVGGKGSNQSVQMASMGMYTQFVGMVGDDDMGRTVREALTGKGVDTRFLSISDTFPTGCASIFIDPSGENMLAYAPGANHNIPPEQIELAADSIRDADIFITQNEINADASFQSLKIARDAGVTTILNPAPATPLDDGLYPLVDYITPNEIETEIYTGISTNDLPFPEWRRESARWFLNRGVRAVCITLGSKGAYFFDGTTEYYVPAFTVQAVDTTAAGDAFIGGFAYGVAQRLPVVQCMEIGSACGALAATVLGAQNSIHNANQVMDFLKERQIFISAI